MVEGARKPPAHRHSEGESERFQCLLQWELDVVLLVDDSLWMEQTADTSRHDDEQVVVDSQ